MAYMKISLIAGLILTAPWVFYQIWMFVAAGLYPKERQYVYKAIPFSAGLFIVGALFFLFVIAWVTLKFFLMFGDSVGVASHWTLQKYISFVTDFDAGLRRRLPDPDRRVHPGPHESRLDQDPA